METNLGATIITVVHTEDQNSKKYDAGEINIVDKKDSNQKSIKNIELDVPLSQENETKNGEDDQNSVIIEEAENETIDVEDTYDKSELYEDHESKATNDSFAKTTEFVVVNAANLSVVATSDESVTNNRYEIEDIQIKDELAEAITADVNCNDVLENDPMDLLELNTRSECTSSSRSQEDTEDYGDDISSVGSSSVQTASSSSVSVHDWIKDYPWLLYEEGDEQFGYCLYCDIKINVKSQRSVKQHRLSLYHKERCENFLAFCDEEEKNGLSMKIVEIKEEFGTDSRVEALKLKRKSQSGALNNFNWRRWLADYPWLERDSAEGTVGYCKYCLIHVNVEFSYLRDRHQEGGKHREAEKQHGESNKVNEQHEENAKQAVINSINQAKKWLQLVENEPSMVQCGICGTKMAKSNFQRHLRTNLHEHNEKVYLESHKSGKNWMLYVGKHPWLVPDPADHNYAFCKYCEKRIIYGASAAKRALHENSTHHKNKESEFKKQSQKGRDGKVSKTDIGQTVGDHNEEGTEEEQDEVEDDQDQNEEEVEEEADEDEGEEINEDDGEEEEEECEADNQQRKESGEENDSKKRIYRLTAEWINQYSWCKRYNKDPTNFIYCIYCKTPLSLSYSRSKHQLTSFHISAEKEFKSRQAKKQERMQSNETFYEWVIPLKNNASSYSCRYCKVRISKNYSKKQHASSKIHQINENIYLKNRRKSLRKEDVSSTQQPLKVVTQLSNVPSKKMQTFDKVVIKAPSTVTLVKQLQKKFPWLSYKRNELRSNYGHCKVCNASLFIRSLKHVLRHCRSPRHVTIIKANKKQKVEKEEQEIAEDISTKILRKGPKEELQTSPTPIDAGSDIHTKPMIDTSITATSREISESSNYKSTISEMKNRFSWIEKSDSPMYVLCRFCDVNIPLKILFLRNHSNSHNHRQNVINYRSVDEKKNKETQRRNKVDSGENGNEDKNDDNNDDIMIIEENNEEILISEQDENWTVKSETVDEHEELDYLLQRSFTNKSNVPRNVRKATNAGDENQLSKRIKRSQSYRRLNDSNTSLVASLLTNPLTLASCLGPLIQQQIQQQPNISQTPFINPNVTTAVPQEAQKSSSKTMAESENTYDLFFKSISETMKNLPVDLAAEGKLRVMQVICDLELQALKRQQSTVSESASCSNSESFNYQSTSIGLRPCSNSTFINDINLEHNNNSNETITTQLNTGADVSPRLAEKALPLTSTNSSNVENANTSTNTSPIIGVMDKSGLQSIHFKTSVPKQVPRSPANSTITTVANSGIRCIPFKNLSQSSTSDTATSNTKITRIQVPLNVTPQSITPNTNAACNSKNLINFRNIHITKRIATQSTSVSPATSVSGAKSQPTATQTSTLVNKSPQMSYITSVQPQLQRWGCSVNGAATPHSTPTSSSLNHNQQLSKETSTPISKKN